MESMKFPTQSVKGMSPEDMADELVRSSGYRFLDVPLSPDMFQTTDAAFTALNQAYTDGGKEGETVRAIVDIFKDDQQLSKQVLEAVNRRMYQPVTLWMQKSEAPRAALLEEFKAKGVAEPSDATIAERAKKYASGKSKDPLDFAAWAVRNPLYYSSGEFVLPESDIERVYGDNPSQGKAYVQSVQGLRDRIAQQVRRDYQRENSMARFMPVTTSIAQNASETGALTPEDEAMLASSAPYNDPEAVQAKREELQRMRDPGILNYGAGVLTDAMFAPNRIGAGVTRAIESGDIGQGMEAMGAAPEGMGDPRNQQIGDAEVLGGVGGDIAGSVAFPMAQRVGRMATKAGSELASRVATSTAVGRTFPQLADRAGDIERTTARAFNTAVPNVAQAEEVYQQFENAYQAAIKGGATPEAALNHARQEIAYSKSTAALRGVAPAVTSTVQATAPSMADPSQTASDVATSAMVGGVAGTRLHAANQQLFAGRNPIEAGVRHPQFNPNTEVGGATRQSIERMQIPLGYSPRVHEPLYQDVESGLRQLRDMETEAVVPMLRDELTTTLQGVGTGKVTSKDLLDELYHGMDAISPEDYQRLSQSLRDRGGIIKKQKHEPQWEQLPAVPDLSRTVVQPPFQKPENVRGATRRPIIDPATGKQKVVTTEYEAGIPLAKDEETLLELLNTNFKGEPKVKRIYEAVNRKRQFAAKETGGVAHTPNRIVDPELAKYDKMQKDFDAIVDPALRERRLNTYLQEISSQGVQRELNKMVHDMKAFVSRNPNVKNADEYRRVVEDVQKANDEFIKSLQQTKSFRDAWAQYSDFMNNRAQKWLSGSVLKDKKAPFRDKMLDGLITIATHGTGQASATLNEDEYNYSESPNPTPNP